MKKTFYTTFSTQMRGFLFGLFSLMSVLFAQAQATGDYRTVGTDNWSTLANWQVRDGSGNWTTAVAMPTSANNVYLQSNHIVTIDVATASCKDLHFCTNHATPTPAFPNPGKLVIGANYVEVSGKMRAYTDVNGATTGATDGIFYSAQVLAVNNFSTTGATTTTGAIRIVGASRTVFNTGEWGASGFSTGAIEFNLTTGATATADASFKFKSITITNGILSGSTACRFLVSYIRDDALTWWHSYSNDGLEIFY